MWRVSYLRLSDGYIGHKGGFWSDKEAMDWIRDTRGIIALKLLVWSDWLDCFRVVESFEEL